MKYEETKASGYPYISYENGVQQGDVRVIERKLYYADAVIKGWGFVFKGKVYWRELKQILDEVKDGQRKSD